MRKIDHESDSHDWEACPTCINQAKEDGILGPDAEPFPSDDDLCPGCDQKDCGDCIYA